MNGLRIERRGKELLKKLNYLKSEISAGLDRITNNCSQMTQLGVKSNKEELEK